MHSPRQHQQIQMLKQKYVYDRLNGLWCFNAIFNNISLISWQSVLSMKEIGGPREKIIDLSQQGSNSQLMIGTDGTGSCKSNYDTITAMMAPCLRYCKI